MSNSIYTPEQRLQCYKAMKELMIKINFNAYKKIGLCAVVCITHDNHEIDLLEGYCGKFKNLPEIKKRKPKNECDEVYWFEQTDEGRKKRIQLLDEAIKEVSEVINQNK